MSSSYIRWFETIRLEDVPLVGGKNASLGELYRELGIASVKVPNGFALTVAAYADALSSTKAWAGLHALLDNLDIADVTELAERAEKARQIVYHATGNNELRVDIEAAYRRLETQYGTGVAWQCAAQPPPRICRRRALPGSTKAISIFTALTISSRRVAAVSRRCSPTVPSSTA
jgi:phosphoenolpyruvate synthase/pyruvate phosphate dikinase